MLPRQTVLRQVHTGHSLQWTQCRNRPLGGFQFGKDSRITAMNIYERCKREIAPGEHCGHEHGGHGGWAESCTTDRDGQICPCRQFLTKLERISAKKSPGSTRPSST